MGRIMHANHRYPESKVGSISSNVSWVEGSGESMRKILISGRPFFWEGNATSGTLIDGNDVVIKKKRWFFIWFDGDMQGKSFTIQFMMKDGSSNTIEFILESFPNITSMGDIENNPNFSGGRNASNQQVCCGT